MGLRSGPEGQVRLLRDRVAPHSLDHWPTAVLRVVSEVYDRGVGTAAFCTAAVR